MIRARVWVLGILFLSAAVSIAPQSIRVLTERPKLMTVLPHTSPRKKAVLAGAPSHERELLFGGNENPFRVVDFTSIVEVKSPIPPTPTEPPVPSAPAFPFRYFGRMAGPDGVLITYLTRGDTLTPISQGMELEGDFRVSSIGDKELVVNYVPLNVTMIIDIRAAE
jgi:hypothetical protein